jgi:hypothetical protein
MATKKAKAKEKKPTLAELARQECMHTNLTGLKRDVRTLEELTTYVSEPGHYETKSSICGNLWYVSIYNLAERWKHWSGERIFPIPPKKGMKPGKATRTAATRAFDTPRWRKNPYGDLRRDLCKFLLKHFRKEVERREAESAARRANKAAPKAKAKAKRSK